jgi:hypothetical protein
MATIEQSVSKSAANESTGPGYSKSPAFTGYVSKGFSSH